MSQLEANSYSSKSFARSNLAPFAVFAALEKEIFNVDEEQKEDPTNDNDKDDEENKEEKPNQQLTNKEEQLKKFTSYL